MGKDFSSFGAADLAEVERLAAQIARRLATRRSRRLKPSRRRGRVDLRRTVRLSMTRGELIDLARRERKIQKTKLVIFCDVSGSMDLYSRLLLQFLYAMQNNLGRMETFVFSTRLHRITEDLRHASYRGALARLGDVRDWSGGTKIGESLRAFNVGMAQAHRPRHRGASCSPTAGTPGEPAILAEALRTMRRRAGKVIWLNPLLGSPDYQPLTQGMQAALPEIDAFLPGPQPRVLPGARPAPQALTGRFAPGNRPGGSRRRPRMEPDHDTMDDEAPVNPSSNPTFRSILTARLSRRGFLAGAGVGLAARGGGDARPAAPGGSPGRDCVRARESSNEDRLLLPPGLQALRAGPLGRPALPRRRRAGSGRPDRGAPGAPVRHTTTTSSASCRFPRAATASTRGLLGVNHENARPELMWPAWDGKAERTREMCDVEVAAHGFTVVEIARGPRASGASSGTPR